MLPKIRGFIITFALNFGNFTKIFKVTIYKDSALSKSSISRWLSRFNKEIDYVKDFQ